MNEERDWNVVMETFGGNSNGVSYYAQRSERNLATEKILAEGLTKQEAFSLLCTFGEVYSMRASGDHYYFVGD